MSRPAAISAQPAAIMASLVDVRNVSAHRCVRLEIHVPAEQAGAVLAAFGWPTAADPVPVALARLVEKPEPVQRAPQGQRRSMTLSQQCALRCQEPEFWSFLESLGHDCFDAVTAAALVRDHLDVASRAEIDTCEAPAAAWKDLDAQFIRWRSDPRARG
jgi:hypothetical protein